MYDLTWIDAQFFTFKGGQHCYGKRGCRMAHGPDTGGGGGSHLETATPTKTFSSVDEYDSYMLASSGTHAPTGSPEEKSLKWYSSQAYRGINNALRTQVIKPAQRSEITNIDAVMNQPGARLKDNLEVYRGVSLVKAPKQFTEDVAKMVPGSTFTDRAYFSTTISRSVAEKFGSEVPTEAFAPKPKKPKLGPSIVMTIAVPAGSRAVYMNKHVDKDLTSHERELLLRRGSRFKVLSREDFPDGSVKVSLERILENDE